MYDKSGLYVGESREWFGPGHVVMRPAKSWHRLVLPKGETTWTLFITFKYQQKWGFLVAPKHKLSYTEYAKREQMGRSES